VRGDAATSSDTEEDGRKLRDLVAELDETTRGVVRLRNERKSFAAIATELGLASPDAARKRYARALIELRSRWKLPGPGAAGGEGAGTGNGSG
jgi:hypothetical protein